MNELGLQTLGTPKEKLTRLKEYKESSHMTTSSPIQTKESSEEFNPPSYDTTYFVDSTQRYYHWLSPEIPGGWT